MVCRTPLVEKDILPSQSMSNISWWRFWPGKLLSGWSDQGKHVSSVSYQFGRNSYMLYLQVRVQLEWLHPMVPAPAPKHDVLGNQGLSIHKIGWRSHHSCSPAHTDTGHIRWLNQFGSPAGNKNLALNGRIATDMEGYALVYILGMV
jgi:hypothetical protein